MPRSGEMQEVVDNLSMSLFGRKQTGDACTACGSEWIFPDNFIDDLSRKEFKISGLCQKCQDSVFGGGS